ncbi:MAG: AraC family transcriptional regulator [Capnocytophaga sp.]|nr:AraC family transcriptional regulator [Capnocytophaga sp.]
MGKGDPSEVKQEFVPVELKLWCCRYWQLQRWNCRKHSFPYWRMYWNKNRGGVLDFQGKEIAMQPGSVYLIPPNTSFASHIQSSRNDFVDYEILGKRVDDFENEFELSLQALLHLYIHFNLGIPYDFVKPGIYTVQLNAFQVNKLNELAQQLRKDNTFDMGSIFKIQSIVMEMLGQSSINFQELSDLDSRVLTVIQYIIQHIDQNHSNEALADIANMAPNSFARLFKQNLKKSVQYFIKEQKIKMATSFFDHEDYTIEEVAYRLGFADRYHFSRIFKQIKGMSPGQYVRKE